jgi:hypothetical protein
LFDIFIDDLVAGLHDTCSEHGICMGQNDVASLLYADDANAILHPNGLQKLMDYIHRLNKWRMQGISQTRYWFHQEEGILRAGEDGTPRTLAASPLTR